MPFAQKYNLVELWFESVEGGIQISVGPERESPTVFPATMIGATIANIMVAMAIQQMGGGPVEVRAYVNRNCLSETRVNIEAYVRRVTTPPHLDPETLDANVVDVPHIEVTPEQRRQMN